ncbi:MAG: histidine phosphatase family protein, partial [Nitriliruptorales bacterium]|nr:histidine phosphatase family protein [Nitriliruptorales bacterium]
MAEGRQTVVIVRHGRTEWSAAGRHTGRTDLSLIDEGRRGAADLGGWLAARSFDTVWTSPLRRAADTCALAGYGDHAEVIEDLVEWDYGELEGRTNAEIVA